MAGSTDSSADSSLSEGVPGGFVGIAVDGGTACLAGRPGVAATAASGGSPSTVDIEASYIAFVKAGRARLVAFSYSSNARNYLGRRQTSARST